MLPIIYGAVQGLTEFIPVSSSGHLLLLHSFLPAISGLDEASFDAALNIGTLIALFGFFGKDLWAYVKGFIASLPVVAKSPQMQTITTLPLEGRLAWFLGIAAMPAGAIGFVFQDFIETTLRSPWVVIMMLVLIALLFFAVERFAATATQQQTIDQMTLSRALLIGCSQALALIPGTSRSGITIITGMYLGLDRKSSARFSFLLSAPIILAATAKKTIDLLSAGITTDQLLPLLFAITSAAVFGIIAISGLLRYLSQRSLAVFAWYRIGLAVLVAILLISR